MIFSSFTFSSPALELSIDGWLGPYISASTNPTFKPLSLRARAKLREISDFPTPPFAEKTPTMFLTFLKVSGILNEF